MVTWYLSVCSFTVVHRLLQWLSAFFSHHWIWSPSSYITVNYYTSLCWPVWSTLMRCETTVTLEDWKACIKGLTLLSRSPSGQTIWGNKSENPPRIISLPQLKFVEHVCEHIPNIWLSIYIEHIILNMASVISYTKVAVNCPFTFIMIDRYDHCCYRAGPMRRPETGH